MKYISFLSFCIFNALCFLSTISSDLRGKNSFDYIIVHLHYWRYVLEYFARFMVTLFFWIEFYNWIELKFIIPRCNRRVGAFGLIAWYISYWFGKIFFTWCIQYICILVFKKICYYLFIFVTIKCSHDNK